jgi:hypothetical protein
MSTVFKKTAKSEYTASLPNGQTLTIRKNWYNGLWDIWQGTGPVWAERLITLSEAKERIRDRYDNREV